MTLLAKFKQITTFVFDVDGVLTDGNILLLGNGEQVRTMNTKDGYALQLAIKKGYKILVISGGDSNAVKLRLEKLGVKDVFMKVENKMEYFNQYIQQHQIKAEEVLFMGDDIPDVELMQVAAIACAPADAVNDIKTMAAYISTYTGGKGCVRDVIEKVMKLRGDWNADITIKSN